MTKHAFEIFHSLVASTRKPFTDDLVNFNEET